MYCCLLPALGQAEKLESREARNIETAVHEDRNAYDASPLPLPVLESYGQSRTSSGVWGQQRRVNWTASDGTEGVVTLTVYDYGNERMGSRVQLEVDGDIILWAYRDDENEGGWATSEVQHLKRMPAYANILEDLSEVDEFSSEIRGKDGCSNLCDIGGLAIGAACGPVAIACSLGGATSAAVAGGLWAWACKVAAC